MAGNLAKTKRVDKTARAPGAAAAPGSFALSMGQFSELVGMIYQGPLEDVPWKSALDLMRRHLKAIYVTLMLRPPTSDRAGLMVNASGDRPVEREASYS